MLKPSALAARLSTSPARHAVAQGLCAGAAALALLGAARAGDGGPSGSSPAQALQAQRAELQAQLDRSPFGRPLVLRSNDSAAAPQGGVWALLEQPFDAVGSALRQPVRWCDILLLQTNIKRCTPAGSGATSQRLEVAVARRYTDPVEQAQAVTYRFESQAAPGYLAVLLTADEGPAGTSNHRLQVQAVPAGAHQTFLHLRFGYDAGLTAQLATRAYLASAGRDKVGFTATGTDAQGRPQYVRGLQGVAERNTMRYFLAIDTLLATTRAPLEQRLRSFHGALERYPAQLHETELDEYLTMKRREAHRP